MPRPAAPTTSRPTRRPISPSPRASASTASTATACWRTRSTGRPGRPRSSRSPTPRPGIPADGVVDRRAARRAQAVVGTLTVLAAFALAALLGGLWAGLAAAAAVAFYPPAIEASSLLVSEPLGALAITAALAAVVWAVQRGGALRVARGRSRPRRGVPGARRRAARRARPRPRRHGRRLAGGRARAGPARRRGAAGGTAPAAGAVDRVREPSRARVRADHRRRRRRRSSSPPTCPDTARSSASSMRCTPSWCAAIRATATCRSSASRRGRS